MRLQLINAPLVKTPGISKGDLGEDAYPPLGILYLAAWVRQEMPGIEIKVTDGLLRGEEETEREIEKFGADVVGISSLTSNVKGAIRISKFVKKKNPETLVVMGGVHPTSLPQETLRESKSDFVVFGEGERILVELLNKFSSSKGFKKEDYQDVKGISYIHKKRFIQNPYKRLIMDLNKIPFPARDLIDVTEYRGWSVSKKRPETAIFSTRGCPFDCHFCSNEVWRLQAPFLRLRSPKNVIDEVEMLVKEYGIEEYFDHADEINSTLDWLEAVCREKIKRKIDAPWKAMLRADKMTKRSARLLAKSRCWYVHLGIESGNQKTMDGIGKKISLEQVISTSKLLQEVGIKVGGLFMLFNVWERDGNLKYESLEETEKTLDFAKSLLDRKLINNAMISQTTPYPGSELYGTANKYGLIRKKYLGKWERWNHTWSFVMKLPKVSLKDMKEVKARAMMLATKHLILTGNIPWRNIGYLMSRGLGMMRKVLEFRYAKVRV